VTLIQRKSAKATNSGKNMMNQTFQHWEEYQSIEAMTPKMLKIQFELIGNLIQMKWTKVISMKKKHDGLRISTFRGISIERSNDLENAENSIHVNWKFDSNEI
jgi:hypothetical protein